MGASVNRIKIILTSVETEDGNKLHTLPKASSISCC